MRVDLAGFADEAEIQEGLEEVERLLSRRVVRTGDHELFKAAAREQGSIQIIDIIRAKLDSSRDEYVADLIASLDINVLAGNPVKLRAVADVVTARGQAADSVELLLFGGDLLFDDVRPGLARAFPRAGISSLGYASVDAGLIGGPVPGDDVRVHEAFTPYIQTEIVDDADEPITTPGVPGRLLVTNMFRTLMPIIRYPAGDRASWIDPERQRAVAAAHRAAPRVDWRLYEFTVEVAMVSRFGHRNAWPPRRLVWRDPLSRLADDIDDMHEPATLEGVAGT